MMTTLSGRAVGYVRISTPIQLDGAGLRLQTEAILQYARQHDIGVTMIFEDVGSGMVDDAFESNQGLSGAIRQAQHDKAPLIVREISRLARSPAAVGHTLRELDIPVISVLDGGLLTLGEALDLAEAANKIGRSIREGTVGALSRRPTAVLTCDQLLTRKAAAALGSSSNAIAAQDLIVRMARILEKHDPSGTMSKARVARLFNDKGLTTRKGGTWDAVNVRRKLDEARAAIALQEELSADFSDF